MFVVYFMSLPIEEVKPKNKLPKVEKIALSKH